MTRSLYGETISLLLLGWWGLWLLLPIETFGTAKVYASMKDLMAEELWGVGFLTLVLLHGITFFHEHLRLRLTCLICEAAAWAFLGIMIFQGNPNGIGWGQYIILSVICILMAARPVRGA